MLAASKLCGDRLSISTFLSAQGYISYTKFSRVTFLRVSAFFCHAALTKHRATLHLLRKERKQPDNLSFFFSPHKQQRWQQQLWGSSKNGVMGCGTNFASPRLRNPHRDLSKAAAGRCQLRAASQPPARLAAGLRNVDGNTHVENN